jgi:hypothetical protein
MWLLAEPAGPDGAESVVEAEAVVKEDETESLLRRLITSRFHGRCAKDVVGEIGGRLLLGLLTNWESR